MHLNRIAVGRERQSIVKFPGAQNHDDEQWHVLTLQISQEAEFRLLLLKGERLDE